MEYEKTPEQWYLLLSVLVPIEVDIGKFLKTLLKNNSTIILSNIHILSSLSSFE